MPNHETTTTEPECARQPSAAPEGMSEASALNPPVEAGYYYGDDAYCVTRFDESDYGKEITITTGVNSRSKQWSPKAMPAGAFIATLSRHKEGQKDGLAFVLADMVPGRRLKTSVKKICGVGLDLDTGIPAQTVDDALEKLRCQAVRYSTHSTGKTKTDIMKDKVMKFAGDREIDQELIRHFLRNVEQWDMTVVDNAEYLGTEHTEQGIVCQITHPPMPKHRIVMLFKEPFDIGKEAPTQAEAMKLWAKVPEALARLLNVPFDTSCTDPSRLFYLPRHAKGKPFGISLFGGPYFDWRTLELEDPMEKLSAAISKGKSKSVTEEGRELGRWSLKRAHGFQIKDVIDAYAPDSIRHNTGRGYEIECPFDEDHSNAGDQEDRACLVVNAGEGPGEFFTISCRHESCRDKTFLDMLGKMLKDQWFDKAVLEDEGFNAILEDAEKPNQDDPETRDDTIRAALENLSEESTRADVECVIRSMLDNDFSESRIKVALHDIAEFTGGRKSAFNKGTLNAMLKEVRKAKASEDAHGDASAEKLLSRISKSLGRPFEFPPKHLGSFALCQDDQGHIWLCREKDSGGQVRLCAPFMLSGGVVYADRNQDRAHRIEILSPEEVWIKLDIDSGKLATVTPVLEDLMRAGFAMTEHGRQFVPQYLAEARPRGLIVYHRAGFRDGCFVCPTGEVLLTDRHVELADDVRLKCAAKSGSLEGWKDGAKALFGVQKAWRFHAGVLLGFVGPMSDLVEDDSLMYELNGPSTLGKSTVEEEAAAPWADPNLKSGGLFCSANGTQNSLETLFEVSSGTLRALDEIGKLPAAVQSDLVFMNQAGSGKHRMNRQGGAQKTRKWGGLVLLVSAETPFDQRLRAEGIPQPGGLSVRLCPIIFDESSRLTKEEFALTKAITANFGWSGPAFVQALADQGYVTEPERLRAEIDALISELPGTEGVEGAFRRRAARPVAYLWKAGLVAAKAGLLPDGYDYKGLALRLWEDACGSDIGPTDVMDRTVATLIDTISARKGREIVAYGERDERGVREAQGYFDAQVTVADGEGKKVLHDVYVIRSTKLAELSGGTVPDRALRVKLADLGFLVRPPKGNTTTWGYFPGLGKAQYVVLFADKIDAGTDADANAGAPGAGPPPPA